MEKTDHELLVEIHEKVSEMPTRREFGRAKREIVKCYYTNKKSVTEQNGPSNPVRQQQVRAVRDLLYRAYCEQRTLSLHAACLKVWEDLKQGYPTPKALYEYCHEHETEF